MTIEDLRELCLQLPGTTESIKWGQDLCFCVCDKMYLVLNLEKQPAGASFKVPDEEFEEICARPGFSPAPYLARYRWVALDRPERLSKQEWEQRVQMSYNLIVQGLPKKQRQALQQV